MPDFVRHARQRETQFYCNVLKTLAAAQKGIVAEPLYKRLFDLLVVAVFNKLPDMKILNQKPVGYVIWKRYGNKLQTVNVLRVIWRKSISSLSARFAPDFERYQCAIQFPTVQSIPAVPLDIRSIILFHSVFFSSVHVNPLAV